MTKVVLISCVSKKLLHKGQESGISINITGANPYLVITYRNSKLSERSLINLPLNSSGECCFNSLEIADFCASKSFGGILNSQIPKCLEETKGLSKKSASLVINNLCSDNDNSKTLPFEIVLGVNLTSCPNLDKKYNSFLCTFSSNKNFILCWDKFKTSFSEMSSKFQSRSDMVFVKGRICLKDFFVSGSIFKHFKNYRNHNPGSLKSGLSMTDFTIYNNIIINLDSHRKDKDIEIYKVFALEKDLYCLETASHLQVPFKTSFETSKSQILTNCYVSIER